MIENVQNNVQSERCGMSLIGKSEGGDISFFCKPTAWRIQVK